MKSQTQTKADRLIRQELNKIRQSAPDIVPVYVILNSQKKETLPQFPIEFFKKDLLLREITKKLLDKYPSFTYFYIFGVDHDPKDEQNNKKMSLKEKRKNRYQLLGSTFSGEKSKIIPIDQTNENEVAKEIYHRYEDKQNNLLVLILSENEMITTQQKMTKSRSQWILLILGVAFAVIFIVLSFGDYNRPSEI